MKFVMINATLRYQREILTFLSIELEKELLVERELYKILNWQNEKGFFYRKYSWDFIIKLNQNI